MKRDIENGLIFGVCSGIAKDTAVDVTLVRVIALLLLVFTGTIVGWIYLIAGLLLPEND